MRKMLIVVVGAIVLLSTTHTMAQQREVVRVCAAHIRAACGDVAPAWYIRSCLNSHLAHLTRPCQAILIGAAAVASECRGASELCAEAWSLAAAELKLVCSLI